MCAELGISPSAFRGRPTVVIYTYDDQGRVARTYTRSQWTEEDRALMLARQEYKRTLCPGCGQPKATAWHWDNEGHFEVPEAYACWGCHALDMADWRRNGSKEDQKPTPTLYPLLEYTRNEHDDPLPPWRPPTQE